jgi:tRNA(Ile)-lysidine synthase
VAALDPAVAAIRTAVRTVLRSDDTGGLVFIACSGGADSLALAAAAAFVAPRCGRPVGLITVDHRLQDGSAARAAAVADWGRDAGLAPVVVETVDVTGRPGGPEAAAREARYEALVRTATAHGAGAVLLGHTRDDQAETVLLALLRGSGPRGLAGMPERRDLAGVALVRPLLEISRQQTRAACTALGLTAWEDPHNSDPAFGRTHARTLLRSFADAMGDSVVANLARTAGLVAADTAVLDDLAAAARSASGAVADGSATGGLRVDALAALPAALRSRVLHGWARELGAPGSALSYRHVAALDALVIGWHGQGPVHLPGALRVARRHNRLVLDDNPL